MTGPDPDEYAKALGYAMIEYWLLLNVIRAMSWHAEDNEDYAVGQRRTRRDRDEQLIDGIVDRAKTVGSPEQARAAESLSKDLHAFRDRRNELIHSVYALPDRPGWRVPNQRIDPKSLPSDVVVEEVTVETLVVFQRSVRDLQQRFLDFAFEIFGVPDGYGPRP